MRKKIRNPDILDDIMEIIDTLDKENNEKGYPYKYWNVLSELQARLNE
jgi:hypothetical protein